MVTIPCVANSFNVWAPHRRFTLLPKGMPLDSAVPVFAPQIAPVTPCHCRYLDPALLGGNLVRRSTQVAAKTVFFGLPLREYSGSYDHVVLPDPKARKIDALTQLRILT